MEQIPTFGEVLRERRSQLGLTQAELARRASCAPITIRKLEGNALRPSVQLAELLALALNIPEAEQIGFVRLARQEKKPSPIPKPTPSPGEIGLDDLSGRAVKGFQLGELIGSGGFGVVYRAVQPSVQRDVAVKIILPRFANHPTFIRRFEAEAHLVARLEHPHIVPLYDYWREPNAAYLIMRLLRGGLNTALEKGPLPLDVVGRIGRQVGQALAAAHAQGVLHQDIKPANILLDDLQNAYLADFGIAKKLAFLEGSSLTEAGTLISSPAYISPEQIRDEPVRPSSDIYCFGLLLYEMLTGQAAFPGPTPVSLLQQHLNQPLPLLRDTAPNLPAGLDDLLQQATAKRPQDRFQEMKSFLNALESVLNPGILVQSSDAVWQTAVPQLTPQEITALENPYRGLRAFTEADADNFFGRETLVQELLSQMSDGSDLERFVAVVGPSGSGKSSLVKAGLLPALRRGGLPGSENWFIVDMTPGSRPWAEVAEALRRVAVNPPEAMMAQLQEDNRGLLRVVNRCLPDDGETELLLLVDQFEELFTLVEDEAVREAFLQSLVTAVLDPQTRLRIVITLRADFTDRPLQYVDFGELIQQRLSLVLPLTPDELMQAITRPVENLGLTMSPDLIATIVQDVGNQPGMLPLLQYALTELFEQRQGQQIALEAYRKTGGVAGALARRADEIYVSLDDAGQEAARQLFLRLVTLGEGVEDTRRRVLLSELEALPGNVELITDSRLPITEYGRYRLLTFDHDPVTRGPTVEVAHEALLREWPRLRGWLRDGREDVQQQRLLAQAAAQWQQHVEDSSYLLRGSRLTSFEAWAESSIVALTPGEHHFLQKSIAERDARHAAEEARRQRELETAQSLADEQTKRAEEQTQAAVSLRRRAIFLAGALLVAAILAVAAFDFARSSNNNANLAITREVEALTNLNLAATNEAEAIINANLAATRETEAGAAQELAQAEADIRATAELVAVQQRDAAQMSERQALESYSLSLAANARQALAADDTELAFLLALAANKIENPPLTSWRTLVDIAYAPGARQKIEYGQALYEINVSHDGRFAVSGASDGSVFIWDFESGEVVKEFIGHTGAAVTAAFSPDDRFIISGSADRTAILWDVESGEMIHRLSGNSGSVRTIDFTPDGRQALLGIDNVSAPGELIVWDIVSGEATSRFGAALAGNQQGVRSLAISPDGRVALVGANNNNLNNQHPLILWDIETQEVIRYFEDVVDWVNGVAISPDGKFGLAAYSDNNVYYYNLETGELIHQLLGHEGNALSVAFSPNGRTALSSGFDRTIIWWDLASGTILQRFRGHTDASLGLSFLNDTQAISASLDGTILTWDLTSNWQIDQWSTIEPENFSTATSLAISPDGRYALSGTHGNIFNRFFGNTEWRTLSPNGLPENGLMLWNYETGELLSRFYGHDQGINDIAFTPDSGWALTASADGSMILWNLRSGHQIKQLVIHSGSVNAVDISDDGKYALSGSADNQVLYWDIQSGRILHRMVGHFDGRGINEVAFLPGDQLAISVAWDRSMIVWDLATGRQIKRLSGLTGDINYLYGAVYDLGVSSDGSQVLSAGDARVLLWDLESGRSINQFIGHPSFVSDVEIHPGGQTFLSIDPDNGIMLWDLATGKLIRHFPTKGIRVVISPDGQTALSASLDGSIIKWQLSEPSPVDLIAWIQENRFIREFTCLERETYQITPLCEDNVAQETTDDLLATVQDATASIHVVNSPDSFNPSPSPINISAPDYPEYEASIGENRGDLTQNQFDIWNYQGQAGEIINIHMRADHPPDGNSNSIFEWFEAGFLDPLLFIVAPDGTLLGRGNDSLAEDGTRLTDAQIDSIVLPEDGIYQIQARSFLDSFSGPYTLTIESGGNFTIDPLILADYEGHYLEGPWEYDAFVFIEEGQLKMRYEQTAEIYDLLPLSDSEFIYEGDGSIAVFTRDDSGQVDGYDTWVSLIHPVGGQWYRAVKLDE